MPGAPVQLPPELRKIRDDLSAALALNDAPEDFDIDAWLQEWLRLPQPALGGVAPMDMLNSRSGIEQVTRILGSLMSNSYQ
ncbi:antitoxin Xre/MbcA/ParS toxin-binding domain-containing protein [Thermomonas fusca]